MFVGQVDSQSATRKAETTCGLAEKERATGSWLQVMGQPRRQTGPVISNPGKLYHPGLKGSGERVGAVI